MPKNSYKYVIIGSGLAGVSAVEGIREIDGTGDILMAGMERTCPTTGRRSQKSSGQARKKSPKFFCT